MLKKNFFRLLLVIFMLMSIFFIESYARTKGVLDILTPWTGSDEIAIRAALDVFQKKYPEVKVNLESLSSMEMKTVLSLEMMTEPRDLYVYGQGGFVGSWAKKGVLTELTDFWNRAGLDNIVDGNLKMFTQYPGPTGEMGMYWIPMVLQISSVFYNKKVFNSIGLVEPTNWVEFINLMEKLKSNGVLPIIVGTMGELYGTQNIIDHLLVSYCGIDFATRLAQGKESYKDSRVVEAFNEYLNFIDKGYVNSNMFGVRFDEALRKFGKGEAAIWWRESWSSSVLAGEFGWVDGVDYGVFSPPSKFSNIPVPELGYADGWMMPLNAEDKDLAELFLKTMVSADAQRAHSVIKGHGVTVNREIMPGEYVVAGMPFKSIQLTNYRKNGLSSSLIFYYTPEFMDEAIIVISELVAKKISVDEAMSRLDEARNTKY